MFGQAITLNQISRAHQISRTHHQSPKLARTKHSIGLHYLSRDFRGTKKRDMHEISWFLCSCRSADSFAVAGQIRRSKDSSHILEVCIQFNRVITHSMTQLLDRNKNGSSYHGALQLQVNVCQNIFCMTWNFIIALVTSTKEHRRKTPHSQN